jgi:hypothetical protein
MVTYNWLERLAILRQEDSSLACKNHIKIVIRHTSLLQPSLSTIIQYIINKCSIRFTHDQRGKSKVTITLLRLVKLQL